MYQSKITKKGQTTIPKKIREEIGLKPGDAVRFSIQDGAIEIRPLISARSLYGILKYEGPSNTPADIEDALEDALRDKFATGEQWSR